MRYLGLLLLLLPMAIAAADEAPVVPEEFVFCTTCHGVQLMGNETLRAPRLSGMEAWYVAKQLRAFKKGWRGGDDSDLIGREMQPMAAALDDRQIVAAARFVSRTRSPLPQRTRGGDPLQGQQYYATCSTCHGANGEGDPETGRPALTGLNDWYLIEQLEKYRDGSRGKHPDDALGQQMRAAAVILPDDRAIADVVAYISTLSTN